MNADPFESARLLKFVVNLTLTNHDLFWNWILLQEFLLNSLFGLLLPRVSSFKMVYESNKLAI